MGEFLTRRLGPLPVWLWFGLFVIGVVLFLKLRGKAGDAASSDVNPSIIQGAANLYPVGRGDTFVNISRPVGAGTGVPAPARTNPWRTPPQPPPNRPGGVPVATGSGSIPPLPSGSDSPLQTSGPVPRQTSITYKVASGDTLTSIARRLGTTAGKLYAANKGTIEAIARQHGMTSSDSGHWIFPGERLVAPQ